MKKLFINKDQHDFILANQEVIKTILMDLAEKGAPKPTYGTMLYNAFVLFTSERLQVIFKEAV